MTMSQQVIQKPTSLGIPAETSAALPKWEACKEVGTEEREKLSNLNLLQPREQLIEQGYGIIEDVFTGQECDRLIDTVHAQTKDHRICEQ